MPLVNVNLERRLGSRATFQLEGDAWAAPQGYRFLEGGADNDEVFTFALVHYLAVGVVFRF